MLLASTPRWATALTLALAAVWLALGFKAPRAAPLEAPHPASRASTQAPHPASHTSSPIASPLPSASPAQGCLQWEAAPGWQAVLDCWVQRGGSFVQERRRGLWTWRPAGACAPPLPALEGAAACDALAGKRLLLIGDSQSQRHLGVLHRVLLPVRTGVRERALDCDSQPTSAPFQVGCVAHDIYCSGSRGSNVSTTLAYVRADHLLLGLRSRLWQPRENALHHPVAAALAALQPSHILLNQGAHYQNDTQLAAAWPAALAALASAAPAARILLRNTPPGHPGCRVGGRPLPPGSEPDLSGAPFHWGDFPRQNALLLGLALAHRLPLLDVATPTALRPDMHLAPPKDCLHYSSKRGSALDTWARLLLGALSTERWARPSCARASARAKSMRPAVAKGKRRQLDAEGHQDRARASGG